MGTGPRPQVPLVTLFGVTSFLASALLFIVEPLVARTLLPVLGGSASVWNSAMFTLQVLLLGGYLLAHLDSRQLALSWHALAAAGSLAASGKAGDELTFYEIDPAIIDLAEDPSVFSFLSDTPAAVRVVAGDGRLTIAAPGTSHDVVIVDAFSSDAIPIHLTREAVAIYRRALTDGGILAFHVSNRFFDLFPVVGRLAEDARLVSLGRVSASQTDGSLPSSAVVLGVEGPSMDALRAKGWGPLPSGSSLWTDDRADVLGAL